MLAFVLLPLFVFGTMATTVWECHQFDKNNALGSCGLGNPRISWGAENIEVVEDPAGSGANVLQIFYANGSCVANKADKGGTQFRAKPFGEWDALTLEYDIMFSQNFQFVRGGKLPGFFGGTGKCSGGNQDTSCFSMRFMWRRRGEGELYAYIPNEKGSWFCDDPGVHCNFKYGHSLGRGSFSFVPGRWHHLTQYVKPNTPSQTDGEVKVKFDGLEVYKLSGLTFREEKHLRIDSLYFSTFFGGSSWDWASGADVYTYYNNFKVTV